MQTVSVIIPCYNAHAFLAEAIQSVKAQTFSDYEIIVVNDGSSNEETIAFLNTLPPDVTVVHKGNGGLSSARNFGIEKSTGEIIITLDSDDKFEKTFFKKAVDALSSNRELGVVSSYVQEFGTGKKIWRTSAVDDFSFFTENRIVACCAFRKKCWSDAGGYDEAMRLGLEDWEFWIRVTKLGWKVLVLPEVLFYYRKQGVSMMVTETRPKMETIVDYVVQKHQDWFLKTLKKGIVEKSIINKKNLSARRSFGLFIEKLKNK